MSAAQADWDDKMRGKAKPAEPMDAQERACKALGWHVSPPRQAQDKDRVNIVAEQIRQAEHAARQDERRKVLEEAASIAEAPPFLETDLADAIRALAEEVT